MLINMFDNAQNKSNKENIIKEDTKFNIKDLRDFVIKNYLEYLQKGYKEKLIEKLRKDLIQIFNINDLNEVERIINNLIDKMFGYDILQKYIDTKDITDIRVVKYDSIYVKKCGVWEKVEDRFQDEQDYEEYIRYCALKNNASINYDIPLIVISDKNYNLRIEIGIEPVNTKSSSLVIRIHQKNQKASLEELFLKDEMLDKKSYEMIINSVNNMNSIIIAGKGGSGKTTLLRAIIEKIPDNKAITINEETMELDIDLKNVIQREVLENRSEDRKVTLEKLMKHSLVMSNDVIVVGEIKGAETSIFIDSISTGHMGLATVHSDRIENIIDRLVILFKRDIKAQNYKEEFIREIFANSIDILIYMKDYKVVNIATISYNRSTKDLDLNIVYRRENK